MEAEMSEADKNEVHEETATEASNGKGTAASPPKGGTQDRPILDGSTVDYGREAKADNPRYGMDDPGLVRHPETGEKTPTPDEEK
ncbi:hypothetical protein Leucomu_02915 [Leucobacter muris]|uniref:Multidrug transporter n=1 Tax=Leucobacter muris TaxID=1935379 RepID=A0ABX5QD73_9MICO|nr:hypothetical protein [Leucobacter muris]QAB17005.1 hypothetical protein Leucomu_02915 [Leucobacter muris]